MKKLLTFILILSATTSFSGCKYCCSGDSKEITKSPSVASEIVHIGNKTEFDKIIKEKKYVVAKFTAKWCGACRVMAPVFKKSAEAYGDKVTFVEVDVDKVGVIAQNFGITGIPAFIYFKDGNKEKQTSGAMNEINFNRTIEDLQK